MKRYFSLIASLLSVILIAAICAGCVHVRGEVFSKEQMNELKKFPGYNSRLNSETKKLPRFSSITTNNCAEIFFIQSSKEYSVTVEGHVKDPLKCIGIKVVGEVLNLTINTDSENVIRNGNNKYYVDSFLKIYVKAPSLSYFESVGTSDFHCERLVQSADLILNMRGTGDFSFTWMKLPGLKFCSAGTGDFSCAGANINDCQLNLLGVGDIFFKSLTSSQINIMLNGTGDIRLPNIVSDNVYASLSGTGDINLEGVCRNKASLVVSGTGELNAENLWAKVVSAYVPGTGSLSCSPEETLVASSQSLGTLIYYGNPANISTTGKVIQKKKK